MNAGDSLGLLVSIVSLIGTLLVAGRVFFRLEARVEAAERSLATLSSLPERLVRIETRLDAVEKASDKQMEAIREMEDRVLAVMREGFDGIRRELQAAGSLPSSLRGGK